jgi:hypothetical protein
LLKGTPCLPLVSQYVSIFLYTDILTKLWARRFIMYWDALTAAGVYISIVFVTAMLYLHNNAYD